MEYSNYIISQTPELKRLTRCNDTIIVSCRAKGIIGDEEQDALYAENNESKRSGLFWRYIVKQKNCRDKLIKIFDKACQPAVGDILREAVINEQNNESEEDEPENQKHEYSGLRTNVAVKKAGGPGIEATGKHKPSENAAPGRHSGTDTTDGFFGCFGKKRPYIERLHDVDPENLLKDTFQRPQAAMRFEGDDYKLPTGFKGLALIINILQFKNKIVNRNGAAVDTHHMAYLFERLGYEIDYHDDYDMDFTKQRISDIIEDFKTECIRRNVSSFTVFLGSHGQEAKLILSNGKSIDVYNHIIYKLCRSPKGNAKWAEIPKMFFVQACRDIPIDKPLEEPINNCMVSWSCLPGTPSNRHSVLGTYYVRCLTEVFMSKAYCTDLATMLKEVETGVWNKTSGFKYKQQPVATPLGNFGKLYFNMDPVTV